MFQWLVMILGVRMSFKFPFLAYASGWKFLEGINFGMRTFPTSLFSERAHFSQYLVPYIAICLYSDQLIKKWRYHKALGVSAVVVSTISGNGIISVIIIWLMFVLLFGKIKSRNRIIVFIITVCAIIGFYYILSDIPAFNNMFSHLFSSEDTNYAKADYRIYRGLDMFLRLPFFGKIFGVGYKHMHMYSRVYNIVSVFDKHEMVYEYFSSVSQILIYSGIVGAALCFMHMKALYRTAQKIVKGLLILQLALWFSTEMIFLNDHIMYSLIIVCVYKLSAASQRKETSVNMPLKIHAPSNDRSM